MWLVHTTAVVNIVNCSSHVTLSFSTLNTDTQRPGTSLVCCFTFELVHLIWEMSCVSVMILRLGNPEVESQQQDLGRNVLLLVRLAF